MSEQTQHLESMLYAGVSHVRTSVAQASALALAVIEAAYGLNSSAWFETYGRNGLWSKMSPVERVRGLTALCTGWDCSVMLAYRSRLRRLMLERHTSADAYSSLLPTLTRCANMLAPSMQKHARHRRMLPTLSASAYGTNRGGAAGRTGPIRPSLRTLAGAALSPIWCEWFMGFPLGWTRGE